MMLRWFISLALLLAFASCGDTPAIVIDVKLAPGRSVTMNLCDSPGQNCGPDQAVMSSGSVAIFTTMPLERLVIKFTVPELTTACSAIDVPLQKQRVSVDLTGDTFEASCLDDRSCMLLPMCP